VDYKAQDDETLVRLITKSHTGALGELHDRYARLIFSVALHTTGDHGAAEDIALEVFVRVWEKGTMYRPHQGKVRAWLSSIARHLAIDWLRREGARLDRRSMSWEDEATNPVINVNNPWDNPEQLVGLSMQRELIRAAVAQLPPEQKQVLALAYFHGQTHRQIAETLDLPLGTVKTRIRLAMQKLRQFLEGQSPVDS
jgi:RNA polymerase sigma-70 factor (ECF subfamily)